MPSKPPAKPPAKGGSIFKKKIGPIPLPVALGIVAIVGYLAYRHFHNAQPSSASTTGVQTPGNIGSTGEDLGSSGTGSGTGADAAGGGMSVADLEGLLQSLQGLTGPATYNYYTGSGSGFPDSTTFAQQNPSTPSQVAAPQNMSAAATSSQPSTAAQSAQTGGSAGPSLMYQPPAPTAPPSSGLGIIQQEEGYGGPPAPVQDIIAAQTVGQDYLASIAPNLHLGVTIGAPTVVNPTVSANLTGASANKKQGIYSIH